MYNKNEKCFAITVTKEHMYRSWFLRLTSFAQHKNIQVEKYLYADSKIQSKSTYIHTNPLCGLKVQQNHENYNM